MAAIPAGQLGGVTALAVMVTGVPTELPLAGEVTVIIPFEVEAAAYDVSSIIGTMSFMSPPPVRLMES